MNHCSTLCITSDTIGDNNIAVIFMLCRTCKIAIPHNIVSVCIPTHSLRNTEDVGSIAGTGTYIAVWMTT